MTGARNVPTSDAGAIRRVSSVPEPYLFLNRILTMVLPTKEKKTAVSSGPHGSSRPCAPSASCPHFWSVWVVFLCCYSATVTLPFAERSAFPACEPGTTLLTLAPDPERLHLLCYVSVTMLLLLRQTCSCYSMPGGFPKILVHLLVGATRKATGSRGAVGGDVTWGRCPSGPRGRAAPRPWPAGRGAGGHCPRGATDLPLGHGTCGIAGTGPYGARRHRGDEPKGTMGMGTRGTLGHPGEGTPGPCTAGVPCHGAVVPVTSPTPRAHGGGCGRAGAAVSTC